MRFYSPSICHIEPASVYSESPLLRPRVRAPMRTHASASARLRMPLSLWMWACVCAAVCAWMSAPVQAQEAGSHVWKNESSDGHRPRLCVLSMLTEDEQATWKHFLDGQEKHYYDTVLYKPILPDNFSKTLIQKGLMDEDNSDANKSKSCTNPADQRIFLAHIVVLKNTDSGRQYLVPVKDSIVTGTVNDWVEASELLDALLADMPKPSSDGSADAPRPLLMLIDSSPSSVALENVPSGFIQKPLEPLENWQLKQPGSATLIAPDEGYDGNFLAELLNIAQGKENDVPPRLDVGLKEFDDKVDRKLIPWENKRKNEKGTAQDSANSGDLNKPSAARQEYSNKLLERAQQHHGMLSFQELMWFLRYFGKPTTEEREPLHYNPITESRVGTSFDDVPLFWMPEYVEKRVSSNRPICNGVSEYHHREKSSNAGWVTMLDSDGDGELPTSLCPGKRYGKEYATDCNDRMNDMRKYALNGTGNRIKHGETFGDLKDNNCDGRIDEYKRPEQIVEAQNKWSWKQEYYYLVLNSDAKEMRYACISRRQGVVGLAAAAALGFATYQVFSEILPYRSCASTANSPFPTLCSSGPVPEGLTPSELQTRSRDALGAMVAGGLGVGLTIRLGVERGHMDHHLELNGKKEEHGFKRKYRAQSERARARYTTLLPICEPGLNLTPNLTARIRTLWRLLQ